jgi:hypothetical protein
MTGELVDTKKGQFRYYVDMTLFRSLIGKGVQYDEMIADTQTVLERKTKSLLSVSSVVPKQRIFKERYFPYPKELHSDAVELGSWYRRGRGAGTVLIDSLVDSILDMKRLGIVSFNEYCEMIRSGEL